VIKLSAVNTDCDGSEDIYKIQSIVTDKKNHSIDHNKSKTINGKNEEPVPVFNGKHKWKDSIDSRFDKLVALVEHQIEHSSWPRGGGVAVEQKY
jgi:hypothetical protein